MIEMLTRRRMFGKDVTRDMFIMTGPCHLARGRKKWSLNQAAVRACLPVPRILYILGENLGEIITHVVLTPGEFNSNTLFGPAWASRLRGVEYIDIVFCPATIQFKFDILFFLSTLKPLSASWIPSHTAG
jgi:hypothetical protein